LKLIPPAFYYSNNYAKRPPFVTKLHWFFVVLCGYFHKNQRGLELKIILSIKNGEEPLQIVGSVANLL